MKKDKLINFDKEIKNAQITYLSYKKIYIRTFAGILFFMVFIFVCLLRKYNIFLLIGIFGIILAITLAGYQFIFWNIIKIINLKNNSLNKTENLDDFQGQLKRRERYSFFNNSVLDYFYENFYPVDYKKEFKEIFNEYYKNDEEKFKKWLNSGEIKPKDLYVKLLSNKELQEDIKKKLLKCSIETTNKNIQKQISDEKKRTKEEEYKENIKKEINEYFK